MTDKTPNIADKVREILANRDLGADEMIAEIESILPPRPTLADMTDEERAACLRMQCDTAPNRSVRGFIAEVHPGGCRVIERDTWQWLSCSDDMVTPRPDLPRLEWPADDQDGEEVTKVDYVSVAGGRTAYGPWTVARLRKKADTTPALPDGWRLADHKDHGRVIVTNPTPSENGIVYYVIPAVDPLGFDWLFCDPDDLTYIDADQ